MPNTIMTGAQLRAWMKRHKFTADELAAALDVSHNAIYRWCVDNRPIDRRTKLALDMIAGAKASPDTVPDRPYEVRIRIDPANGSVTLPDGEKARRPRHTKA